MAYAIQTENLTKKFKHILAVNDLNLNIKEGDTFGFLGPNGAGKTTTIRMLTGFLRPTHGSIKILGHDIFKESKKAKEHIGLVPDIFGLYDVLNADEHLEFYGSLYGLSKSDRRKNIDSVLELVELTEHRKRKIKEYSHGMRQRLVIAAALLNKPKLLFLDEPTNGLDPKGAYDMRKIIKDLAKGGITIFMSSHQLNEVQDVCQTVGIIHMGVLLKFDTIANLTKELQLQKGNFVNIELTTMADQFANALKEVQGVQKVFPYYNTIKVQVENTDNIPYLVHKLVSVGAGVRSVTEMRPDLEQIFLSLTEGT